MGRRVEKEKKVVEQMIRLYCRKHEGHAGLCPSCQTLLGYAQAARRCWTMPTAGSTDVVTVSINPPARNAPSTAIGQT